MKTRPIAPLPGFLMFALAGLSSCSSLGRLVRFDFIDYPDSRVENLERLHTGSGRHHYSVQFVGDFDYAFNSKGRSVGGLRIGAPDGQSAARTITELDDPATSCLELLGELLDFDSRHHLRLEVTQISWCARIIEQDPAQLSRERATLALGKLGRRVHVGGPLLLPIDAPRANARETAQVLTETVKVWNTWRAGQASREDWQAQAARLSDTPFDLAGARRVLPVLGSLVNGLKKKSPYFVELEPLLRAFERQTIQLALGEALRGRREGGNIVRAAVVRATVTAAGNEGLARLMPLLVAEREAQADGDGLVKAEILGALAAYGLPDSLEGIEQDDYDRLRDNWTSLLVGIAVEDLEGKVRIKAMQALGRLVGEPNSLREEDWEEWFYAREEAKRAARGQAPTPQATDPVQAEPARAERESGDRGS